MTANRWHTTGNLTFAVKGKHERPVSRVCLLGPISEYDETMRRVRDRSVSFLIASPDGFWIGETAKSVHKHGYSLTAVKSFPAPVGPFDDTCDRSEGTAAFSNGVHEFELEKPGRKWSVNSNDGLRRFGPDGSLDDEKRFRRHLDFYLAQK